jgi:hypothetical protein
MQTCFPRAAAVLATLALAPLLGGCGGPANGGVPITGQVTLDGQPVKEGAISFMPVDGKSASAGGKIIDGKYECAVPPGEKSVTIYANRVTGQQPRDPSNPGGEKIDIVEQYIPAKYNTNSTLKITVPAEGGQFDMKLESK